jgi:cation diffusion facilitator CzcD-associated flavoprotein CzcO
VLGAGATAWDRAADLLELGAHSVTIYMRRNKVLAANPFRYLEKAGYLRHYQSMDDAGKWRWIRTILSFGQPPTQDGVDRCATFENFTLHAGCNWAALSQTDSGIEVTGTDGSVELFDHLFIGCGFSMDASGRPELAELAPNILTWADVYTPPAEYQDDWLQTYPYLDKSLRFMEREPGATPVLRNLFCFNYGALVSNAHSGASLSGILYGLPTLIHGVTGALWAEDEPEHFRMTKSWQAIDTDPGKLAQRLWKPASSR